MAASAALTMLFVAGVASAASVDGATIHWTSKGTGSRTVMFIHGWTCDATSWDAQVPVFSQKYRVITLDLPGHGRSGAPASGKFSMELFARAVEAVRVEAKVDRAVLVGHSMGTPVIRQYALMYPQHVSALVLVDGLVQIPGGGQAFTPPPMTGEAGLKARETMVRGMFGPSTPAPVQQHILKMMLGTSEATAAGAMNATWDTSQWNKDPITVPVLGIYADRSGLANREGMKGLYPSLEYHEIPGTGHFVMMDKPEEFNALLTMFLAKVK
jgi:pimeloyl-ACP methyl ester carboxylesterase